MITTTMSKKKTTILISLLALMGWLPSSISAQEDPLKNYADTCRDLKLCFYPSTLRMINLNNNPDLDELVSGVEKLLVYSLDSSARAN